MFTNSPLHFSQRSFIKPAELFLYVFLIIASERSRIVYLTFWCPSGNNAINHLWPLLFQADICSRVTHWLSRLGLLLFPTWTDRQTYTHTHTPPQVGTGTGTGRRVLCWGPAWGTQPMAKVMRKEAWHTQRRDRASGVPLEILKHLPP